MDKLKNFLIARLSERSTWRGLVLIATALGVTLSPEQAEAVITLGLAVVGVLGAFTADKQKAGTDAPTPPTPPTPAVRALPEPERVLPPIELQSVPGRQAGGATGFNNR